jgi:hypothetical protein
MATRVSAPAFDRQSCQWTRGSTGAQKLANAAGKSVPKWELGVSSPKGLPAKWVAGYHVLAGRIGEGWQFGFAKGCMDVCEPGGEWVTYATPAELERALGVAVKVRKVTVRKAVDVTADAANTELVDSLREECIANTDEIRALRAQVAVLTDLAWQWQAHAELLQARLDMSAVELIELAGVSA